MISTLIIGIITFALLILSIILIPKFKIRKFEISTYWVVALLGALAMIISQNVNFIDIGNGLFNNDSSMNPIKILILFFSTTFISIFLEHAGFFRYLASLAAKKSHSNQIVFFVILYFLIAFLTIVTSNDIVILTFSPFICYFCKNTKVNPLPYLIAEFVAANTWSMMLIIGNPTNLYLGANAGISFIDYFKVMALPTLITGLIEFLILYIIFHKSLKVKMNVNYKEEKITNKVDVVVGLSHLIICIVLLSISNILSWPMWLICLGAACSLFIYFMITRLYKKTFKDSLKITAKSLPFALIPFVISMFVIVIAFQKQGISNEIGKFLGEENVIIKYGISSFVFSNLINNIPMSILFSTISPYSGTEVIKATYASIIGSNIGAFLTPIGALAGIMFVSLLKKHDVKLSFAQFSFYGVILAIPALFISLGILALTNSF